MKKIKNELPKCPHCGRAMYWRLKGEIYRRFNPIGGNCGICQHETIEGPFAHIHKDLAAELSKNLITQTEYEQYLNEKAEAEKKKEEK